MTFQEAITAQAILVGGDLPKASNHDKPERRVERMIGKGWVAVGGESLTDTGASLVIQYGSQEGWHPEMIEKMRILAAASKAANAEDQEALSGPAP